MVTLYRNVKFLIFLICYCRFDGQIAFVRFATGDNAILDAKQEVANYQRMKHPQAVSAPELLGHGYTAEGKAYFVATKFHEVL